MIETSANNKRLAKNTLLLYVRMLFSLIVALYTSRVFINTLGISDYGIMNVVGGIVTMFTFINNTMATASQRFIAFALGQNDYRNLCLTFQTSKIIHLGFGILIVSIVEIVGLWLLTNKLNINPERIVAAKWVFQCSTLSMFVAIISVPYNACITAHERLNMYAYVGIFEVCARLAIALILPGVPFDKLKIYAVLTLMVSITCRIIYQIYCYKNFEECRSNFLLSYDRSTGRRMFSFFGWNNIGAFAYVAREQGVNIVINIFSGTTVNAARAISSQVTSALYGFISNFQTAINPQITKSYASGNIDGMTSLVYRGSKFSSFLFMFLALPVFIYTSYFLEVWLKVVPDYAVQFIRFTIILMLIECLASPIITSLLAIGKIKNYQIIAGTLLLLNLPCSYLFLYWGFSPVCTVVIAVALSFATLCVRLFLLRLYVGISIRDYVKNILLKIGLVLIMSSIVPWIIYANYNYNNLFTLTAICFSCWCSSLLSIYYAGLSNAERMYALKIIKEKIRKK